MRRVAIGILTVGVLGLLFVVLCTYRARPYEMVVVDRFGSVSRESPRIAYNWHLCLPTDKIVRMDNRLHLHQSSLQQVALKGADTLSIQAFAAWRIKDPEQFYRSFQGSDESAQFRIAAEIAGKVGAIMGRHGIDELCNTDASRLQIDQIEQEVTREVNAKMESQGIVIQQVGFSRMAFPPDVVVKVYDRMAAERNERIKAFGARGESEAKQIVDNARAAATEMRAKARAQAAAIMAEGDRDALRIISESARQDYEFYRFWRELEMIKNAFSSNAYAIFRVDMSLMDQFLRSGIGPTPPAVAAPLPTTQPGGQPGATISLPSLAPGIMLQGSPTPAPTTSRGSH